MSIWLNILQGNRETALIRGQYTGDLAVLRAIPQEVCRSPLSCFADIVTVPVDISTPWAITYLLQLGLRPATVLELIYFGIQQEPLVPHWVHDPNKPRNYLVALGSPVKDPQFRSENTGSFPAIHISPGHRRHITSVNGELLWEAGTSFLGVKI